MQIILQQSEGKNGGNKRGKWESRQRERERERERDSNIKYKIEGVEPLSWCLSRLSLVGPHTLLKYKV